MEIKPFEAVGALQFGISRSAARSQCAGAVSTFRKTPSSENLTDCFDELGLHLYYDKDDRLEFIEAFEPASITFRGIDFLGRPVRDVIADMQSVGCWPTQSDQDGVVFGATGLAMTVSAAGVVEGVAASSRRP